MQFGFTQYQFDSNAGDIQAVTITVNPLNHTAKAEATRYVPSTGETERFTVNYTLTVQE